MFQYSNKEVNKAHSLCLRVFYITYSVVKEGRKLKGFRNIVEVGSKMYHIILQLFD